MRRSGVGICVLFTPYGIKSQVGLLSTGIGYFFSGLKEDGSPAVKSKRLEIGISMIGYIFDFYRYLAKETERDFDI